jgi:ABC-type antimicrobial peptide transport system permease subunit
MASVGVYAVIAHATGSRAQEIGVRIALGATIHNILLLVMKRGLWQIAAGLALGLGAALPLAHLMASLPIGVTRFDSIRQFSSPSPSCWHPLACLRAGFRHDVPAPSIL